MTQNNLKNKHFVLTCKLMHATLYLYMQRDEYIKWQAPTHEHREHSTDWYWAVSIITISLAIAFFIAGNMLLSIILIVGISTLLVHSKNPQHIVDYEISHRGIRSGKTLYEWASLDSFWILEAETTKRNPTSAKVLIISKKPLMPHIVILLNQDLVADIHEVLLSMLPEEHQIEPLPDRLMRFLGF